MNVENINKLIEYVKVRTWRSENWSHRTECCCGMIRDITHDNRRHVWDEFDGQPIIEAFLGLGRGLFCNAAAAIYAMGTYTKTDGFKPRGNDTYDHFAALSLEQQNAVLVDMLERFRDTGEVIWNIP